MALGAHIGCPTPPTDRGRHFTKKQRHPLGLEDANFSSLRWRVKVYQVIYIPTFQYRSNLWALASVRMRPRRPKWVYSCPVDLPISAAATVSKIMGLTTISPPPLGPRELYWNPSLSDYLHFLTSLSLGIIFPQVTDNEALTFPPPYSFPFPGRSSLELNSKQKVSICVHQH